MLFKKALKRYCTEIIIYKMKRKSCKKVKKAQKLKLKN